MQISRDVARRFKGAINSLWTVSAPSTAAPRSAQGWSLLRSAAAVLCFAVLMFATHAPAQTTGAGSIQGLVTDSSGAVIPNAVVTLTEQSTQVTLTTKTSSTGDYAFPNINVGTYTLTVAAPGFDTYSALGNVLEVGSSISLNAKMTVGSTDTKIEVHSNGLALQTEDPSFKQTIDKNELLELPLNGRHITDLIIAAGGSNSAGVQDATGSKFPNQAVTISIGGAGGNMVSYRLDGGNNQDYMGGGNYPLPFPDALGQFSVETAALGAQDGVHIGGLVNVITQSGTNTYHGSIFEFIRNNYLDAVNFFTPPCVNGNKPPACGKNTLHQNEYGGTFGGPVRIPGVYNGKDKLFFFAAFQHEKDDSSAATSNAYLPTAANILGDFSGTDPAPGSPTSPCGVKAQQLYDPVTGLLLPGNKYNNGGPTLPVFNAASLALLHYLPYQSFNASTGLPVFTPLSDGTDVCGHVQYAIPSAHFDTEFDTRVDFNINKNNNLYVRYFLDSFQFPSYFSPTNILLTTASGNPEERFQSITIGENYIVNASVVNSVHFTAIRQQNNRGYNTNDINAATLGVNVYQLKAVGLFLGASSSGLNHNFNIGGDSNSLATLNDDAPIDLADDVTWIHGKHQIAFGGEFSRNQLNINNVYRSNGNFSFSGIYSGTAPGATKTTVGDSNLDFLTGSMNSFQQSKPQQNALRGSIPTLYVQDTFHATPNLTVTAGIRWEPLFFPHDYFHRGATFDMARFLANQISPNAYPVVGGAAIGTPGGGAPAGVQFYGDPGVPGSYSKNSPYNFNPNFAFTYDLRGNGRTVVRAGVEYAYDEPNFFVQQRVQENPPFATQASPNTSSAICFSQPWLVGGTGNGCYQTGGTNTSPFPAAYNADPKFALFPAQSQYIVLQNQYQAPDTLQWTASIQQQFSHGWNAQVFYTGNRTQRMVMGIPLSPAVFVPGTWTGPGVGCPGVVTTGPAAIAAKTRPGDANSATGQPCSSTGDQQARYALTIANPTQGNQFLGGGNSLRETNSGYANYNGVIVTVQHRLSSTFSLLTNYTWSKCLNNSDPQGDISGDQLENPANPSMDYGRCSSETRNIFNASVVAKSAFSIHGIAGYLLNNWELVPNVHSTSGQPINVTSGSDVSLTALNNDRPNLISGVNPYHFVKVQGSSSSNNPANRGYFNQAAFAVQPAGTYGNIGRNAFSGPMYFNMDAQISRIFPIEKVSLDVRMESFNVLNHPNFNNPSSSNPSSGTFGDITSQNGGPRIFQGAVKLSF